MSAMSVIDWAILVALGLSILIGLLRGFVREVISILGWIAGLFLAIRFSAPLAQQIPLEIEWPIVKTLVAGALIVVACVFVAALLGWVMQQIMSAVKLTAADRLLGAMFGLARGLLVLGVLVFFAHDTTFARQAFWRDSALLPHVEAAVRFAARQIQPGGRLST